MKKTPLFKKSQCMEQWGMWYYLHSSLDPGHIHFSQKESILKTVYASPSPRFKVCFPVIKSFWNRMPGLFLASGHLKQKATSSSQSPTESVYSEHKSQSHASTLEVKLLQRHRPKAHNQFQRKTGRINSCKLYCFDPGREQCQSVACLSNPLSER